MNLKYPLLEKLVTIQAIKETFGYSTNDENPFTLLNSILFVSAHLVHAWHRLFHDDDPFWCVFILFEQTKAVKVNLWKAALR